MNRTRPRAMSALVVPQPDVVSPTAAECDEGEQRGGLGWRRAWRFGGARRAGVYMARPPGKWLRRARCSGSLAAILTNPEPVEGAQNARSRRDVECGPDPRAEAHACAKRRSRCPKRAPGRRWSVRRGDAGPLHRHRARHPALRRRRARTPTRAGGRAHERRRHSRLPGVEPGASSRGDVAPQHPPPGRLRRPSSVGVLSMRDIVRVWTIGWRDLGHGARVASPTPPGPLVPGRADRLDRQHRATSVLLARQAEEAADRHCGP